MITLKRMFKIYLKNYGLLNIGRKKTNNIIKFLELTKKKEKKQ